MQKQTFKIIVLAGGESGERDVSLDSSRAIARALIDNGHSVDVVDALNGEDLGDDFISSEDRLTSVDYTIPGKDEIDDAGFMKRLRKAKDDGVDVVFNGLHGGAGENGAIPAMLDFVGLPYTGSPMAASAIAMNKDISKRVMWSLNIPTAKWRTYRDKQETRDEMISSIRNEFEFPLIVKPTDCGSTVGLSLVESVDEVGAALESAFSVSHLIMAEKYFIGREITIAVLDGKALPPVEIKPTHKLYDYACKYTKGKSEYFCPADIDENIIGKLSDDAIRLYQNIGCEGYTRVDFIVSDIDHYVCLELNTLPGMTELSLFPMAANEVGVPFGQLLDTLCLLALERK